MNINQSILCIIVFAMGCQSPVGNTVQTSPVDTSKTITKGVDSIKSVIEVSKTSTPLYGEISKKLEDIERFNYKKFLKNKIGNRYRFLSKDSSQNEWTETNVEFQEKVKLKNIKFFSYKTYYKSNRKLKSMGNYFSSFRIGIHKSYKSNGIQLDSTNYDEPFKFSIYDLQNKILSGYNIDIFSNDRSISVSRNNKTQPTYFVEFPATEGEFSTQRLLINGVSGELITNAPYNLTK